MENKIDKEYLQKRFRFFVKKMEMQNWNLKLEFMENGWKNTGNFKIDMDDRSAVVYMNFLNPKSDNLEEVMIHELCHIKMWKLDQYCESLLDATFDDKTTAAYKFGYNQFMCALEQTVQEFAKTYTALIANKKELSFVRCETQMPFRKENL